MTEPTERFTCDLTFANSFRATQDEINNLLGVLIDSLTEDGVVGLFIGGDLCDGSLNVSFDVTATENEDVDDSLVAFRLVVRALNRGRVSAPGWPDDEVIDGAIAAVKVRDIGLVPT